MQGLMEAQGFSKPLFVICKIVEKNRRVFSQTQRQPKKYILWVQNARCVQNLKVISSQSWNALKVAECSPVQKHWFLQHFVVALGGNFLALTFCEHRMHT